MEVHDKTYGVQIKYLVQLIDLIAFYYEHNPAGGWLHIALDDGNLEDKDIWFCQEETEKHEDWLGRFIADRLRDMTYEERDQIRNKIHNREMDA